jgi:hypothetical protein
MSMIRRWLERRRAERHRREADRQPVPQFIFERGPIELQTRERINGVEQFSPGTTPQTFLTVSGEAPYRLVRLERQAMPIAEMPRLTVISDPNTSIYVSGIPEADAWRVEFCAHGEGNTEEEAKERLARIHLERGEGVLRLCRPLSTSTLFADSGMSGGELAATGPACAPVLIHASYCYVHVRDVSGPLHVSAAHGRVSLLDTSGEVDAVGFCIDLATAATRALLSVEGEVNLKLRPGFSGLVTASAQHRVSLRVPADFRTAFRVRAAGGQFRLQSPVQ